MGAQVLYGSGVDLGVAEDVSQPSCRDKRPGSNPTTSPRASRRPSSPMSVRTSTEPRCPQRRADLTDGTPFHHPGATRCRRGREGSLADLRRVLPQMRRVTPHVHPWPLVPAAALWRRGAEETASSHLGGRCNGSEEPEAGRNEVAVGLEDERRHATDVEGVEEGTPG